VSPKKHGFYSVKMSPLKPQKIFTLDYILLWIYLLTAHLFHDPLDMEPLKACL